MNDNQIANRCASVLKMSADEAKWVADNLYNYACPDFSEWDWSEIDECFRSVLWFRGKTKAEVKALLT